MFCDNHAVFSPGRFRVAVHYSFGIVSISNLKPLVSVDPGLILWRAFFLLFFPSLLQLDFKPWHGFNSQHFTPPPPPPPHHSLSFFLFSLFWTSFFPLLFLSSSNLFLPFSPPSFLSPILFPFLFFFLFPFFLPLSAAFRSPFPVYSPDLFLLFRWGNPRVPPPLCINPCTVPILVYSNNFFGMNLSRNLPGNTNDQYINKIPSHIGM